MKCLSDATLLVVISGTAPVSGRWPPALPTQPDPTLLVVTRGTAPVSGRWLVLPTKPDPALLLQSGESLINYPIEDTIRLVLILPRYCVPYYSAPNS